MASDCTLQIEVDTERRQDLVVEGVREVAGVRREDDRAVSGEDSQRLVPARVTRRGDTRDRAVAEQVVLAG